jgi:hypothetical protein
MKSHIPTFSEVFPKTRNLVVSIFIFMWYKPFFLQRLHRILGPPVLKNKGRELFLNKMRSLSIVALACLAAPAAAFSPSLSLASKAAVHAPMAARSSRPMAGPTMLVGGESGAQQRLLPAARSSAIAPLRSEGTAASSESKGGIDIQLIIYFGLW